MFFVVTATSCCFFRLHKLIKFIKKNWFFLWFWIHFLISHILLLNKPLYWSGYFVFIVILFWVFFAYIAGINIEIYYIISIAILIYFDYNSYKELVKEFNSVWVILNKLASWIFWAIITYLVFLLFWLEISIINLDYNEIIFWDWIKTKELHFPYFAIAIWELIFNIILNINRDKKKEKDEMKNRESKINELIKD